MSQMRERDRKQLGNAVMLRTKTSESGVIHFGDRVDTDGALAAANAILRDECMHPFHDAATVSMLCRVPP
jgi:hypothetical protein